MSTSTHGFAALEAPAKTASPAVSPARLLRLQRTCACGGTCESCKKKQEPRPMLQRKAVPGAPAPHAAMPPPARAAAPASPKPAPASAPAAPRAAAKAPTPPKALRPQESQRAVPPAKHPKSATPAITEKKKSGDAVADLPPIVRQVLATPGEPLDFATRTGMEARFGHSFRDVRIHTGSRAAESARAVYAHAYTVGQDIVFDSGRYQPQTAEGQHLLAHELAHTLQQHGLQKSGGTIASDTSGDYQHLEREADAVARSVMARAPSAGAPLSATRAAQPRLARASSTQPKSSGSEPADKQDEYSWTPAKKGTALAGAGVRKVARLKSNPDLVAVQMAEPFKIPEKKGPEALKLWKAQANQGALQAIMSPGGSVQTTSAALKQRRPGTSVLQKLWLQKMGWDEYPAKTIRKFWKEAARAANLDPAKSTFLPKTKAGGKTCDVDHILELQFGGNNLPMNMQMLDSSPNRSSGALIGQFLKETTIDVRDALKQDDPTTGKPGSKITAIRLQFDDVKLSSEGDYAMEGDCKCCQLEQAAKDPNLLKDEEKVSTKGGTRYPMRAGAFNHCVTLDDENKIKIDLLESRLPENKAVSTMIPGLLLDEWILPTKKSAMTECSSEAGPPATEAEQETASPGKPIAGKGKAAPKASSQAGGKVMAEIDSDSRVLKKLKVKKNQTIELLRDAEGHLTAPIREPRIGFAIDYLSEGYFTKLNLDGDGNLSGAGRIVPSVPFLPRPIDVEFDKDRFVMTTQVKKPSLPIRGVEITECSIGLEIGPEFKPEGKVGFRVAPGGKEVLHGLLTVSADENGLVVTGDVFASLPGVDEAKGNLTLKNKEWSGGVDIKAGDFGGKLKYIKNGNVSIRFSQQQGMTASGAVELSVPGVTEPVSAKVFYDRDGWSFRGKATFHPPRIKPVEIDLEYANGHLSGDGHTGFEFNTLHGDIHVVYRDEMFSGDAVLGIHTERAEGSIKVEMHHRPSGAIYFTGEGHVDFKITPDLVAGAGVKVDEQEKVTVTGELAFTKPIKLFDGFSGSYTFFSIQEPIPLPPPLSIGGIGLEAYIKGSLSAAYSVGPVLLEDVKATAEFQPLEKDPAIEMDLTSKLSVAAMGSVSGSIAGGLEINAYIASAGGDIGITVTAQLTGGMDVPFHAHYKDGRITADVGFDASLKLALILALTASAWAKAGVGWLSVETDKTWTLGSFTYDPGLSLGMSLKIPIHYATGEGLTLPSVNDINWVKPKLDGQNLVRSAASSSNAG